MEAYKVALYRYSSSNTGFLVDMGAISKKALKYRAKFPYLKGLHISSDDGVGLMQAKFKRNEFVDQEIYRINQIR